MRNRTGSWVGRMRTSSIIVHGRPQFDSAFEFQILSGERTVARGVDLMVV
ncbi:MAG: hypothetical protein AAF628_31370 [Planctomycetota bacterium]